MLIVDDEPAIRDLLERVLDAAGFDVHTSASGIQAFGDLLDLPRVDCVVSDLVMPGADGLYLLEYVATEWPHVGRVLHTAHMGLVETFTECAVVEKASPGEMDALVVAIRNEIELRSRVPAPPA